MTTLLIDLKDAADRRFAREMLDRFDAADTSAVVPVGATVGDDGELLAERVAALLGGYGRTRRTIVQLIAKASPGAAPRTAVYAAASAISGRDGVRPGRTISGLHSACERSWKRVGGRAAYGRFFTTSALGFTMRPDVASAVLAFFDSAEAAAD